MKWVTRVRPKVDLVACPSSTNAKKNGLFTITVCLVPCRHVRMQTRIVFTERKADGA